MSIFDRLSSMARVATDKASDTLEITRINNRINAERTRVESIKTRIGDYYWQKHLLGEETDSPTHTFCQEIAALEDIIADLQNQIQIIRERSVVAEPLVPATHTTGIAEDSTPVVAKEELVAPGMAEPVPDDTILCPTCGTRNNVGIQFKFCVECGARLPQAIDDASRAVAKPKNVAADANLVIPLEQDGPSLMVCLSCGAALQPGMQNCGVCGTKV